jgi:preprotein translocase subunit SecF
MRTPTFDFVGRTKLWLAVSAGLIALSLGSLLIGGLDLSIDFVGGSAYRMTDVRGDLTTAELRDAAEDAGAEDVFAQLQTEGERITGALVRAEAMEPGSPEAQAVESALQEVSEAGEITASFVGPTWGERITRQAVEALLVFLVVVLIYISFRLEFKMAVAAIVALVHDLLVTIGLYALFDFNVSPATVIALLTILGYSLYDSVVVFDRIKENHPQLGEPGRRTYAQLVNVSMNEVLYRSLNTSITSLLPVGALLFLGAQILGATTLQDLALALFIGMAVGVYSSLFVAGPLLAWWHMKEPENIRLAEKAAREYGDEDPRAARVVATPEEISRAPITTEYVRGEGKKKRKKR